MSNLLRFPSTTAMQRRGPQRSIQGHRASLRHPLDPGRLAFWCNAISSCLEPRGSRQPEEVLAITFTNKATAELRERVLEQLQRAKQGMLKENSSSFELETWGLARLAIERSERLGWGLLERPSRLNIRSIDSVCAEIANSLPLLSGSGGPRQPVEDAEPLYRLAARRTLLQLGGEDSRLCVALSTVLLHRDGNLADCETLLANMLRTREQWGELVPLGPRASNDAELDRAVRMKLERSLESIVCAGLSRALRALPADVLQELTSLAARPRHRTWDRQQSLADCAV